MRTLLWIAIVSVSRCWDIELAFIAEKSINIIFFACIALDVFKDN